MFFASDNWAGASQPIMEALARHNDGYSPAYGGDPLTDQISQKFRDIFETDCDVWMVATGTAANALSLSCATGPGGAVFCHKEAHIRVDECGAPEFISSGARMWGLEGRHCKLTTESIKSGFEEIPQDVVHHGMANAISLSQATEAGTAYSVSEIESISELAKSRDLALHMDGARFANALVSLGCSPAEMTWKAGVDMLSFGATKNGAWAAEAAVFFNKDLGKNFEYRRKRAGHLFSKMRFAAAQFDGYFKDDHWLDNARHANGMASKLIAGIQKSTQARLAWDSQSNEVFVYLPKDLAAKIENAGAAFHEWPANTLAEEDKPQEDFGLYRLVCSYRTTDRDVDQFLGFVKD